MKHLSGTVLVFSRCVYDKVSAKCEQELILIEPLCVTGLNFPYILSEKEV